MVDTYTLSVQIVGKIKGLEDALGKVSSKLGSASEGFSNIGRSLAPITAGVVALGVKTGKTSIDFLSLKENAQAAFTQLLGSGDKATKMMDDLYSFAKTTPFKYDTYLKSAQSLMAMGTSAKDVIPYLEGITNAAIGTGKGTEGVEQLTTAFSKMSSRGKISLEELNMVMEAGVPATKILANQYGVTTDEMYNMISSGELMASDVLPKLVQGMNEGTNGAAGMTAAYGGMAEAYKNTLSGSIDSMTSRFRNMSIQMWDAENAYPALIKVIQSFTNTLDLMPMVFQSVADAAAPALESIANGLDRFTAYMKELDPAQVQKLGNVILGLAAGGAVFMGLGAGLRQLQLWTDACKWAMEGLKGAIHTVGAIPGKTTASVQKLRDNFTWIKNMAPVIKSSLNIPQFATIAGSAKMATSGLRAFGRAAVAAVVPFLPLIIAVGALAAVIAYLWKTDEQFRSSMIQSGKQIAASFIPVLDQLKVLFTTVAQAVAPLITTLVSTLVPAISQIASTISSTILTIMPVIINIIQTISNILLQIMPTISSIITFVASAVSQIIQFIAPVVVFIIGVVAKIITVILKVITTVVSVMSRIWQAVSPVVTRIFTFIKTIFAGIGTVVKGIVSVFSSVFSSVYKIVSTVFNKISGVWKKLTGVVGDIAAGISSAFTTLVNHVKGLINKFIGGVNAALKFINKIPKVNIPTIPKLARGTDNWVGGFAVMNEGGRGEVVHLPNGAQVIPHDISEKYAKEAARYNNQPAGYNTEALTAAVVAGISQMSGPLGDSLKEAVSGMGIEVNGREFGRVVEEYL